MTHTKVHTIRTVKFGFVNYVHIGIDLDTRKAFVVDPAWNLEAITKYLQREELCLEMVLLTHSHMDHVDLANEIAELYHVPVYISRTEAEYYHFTCRNRVLFEDMEELSVGTKKITCIETPGHTKGSTCFLFDNSLCSGDTIFIEGCGICNLDGGSAYDMFHSFQKIRSMLSEDTLIYPSHRYKNEPGQTFEFVKNSNIYFAISNPEDFANFRNRPNFKGTLEFV